MAKTTYGCQGTPRIIVSIVMIMISINLKLKKVLSSFCKGQGFVIF
jgi:hypothetical protein